MVPALEDPAVRTSTALSATRIAASPDAEIVPALLMPGPVKVDPEGTTMPEVTDAILLAASTAMPWVEPSRLPLSMMAPAIVLAAMTMALGGARRYGSGVGNVAGKRAYAVDVNAPDARPRSCGAGAVDDPAAGERREAGDRNAVAVSLRRDLAGVGYAALQAIELLPLI